MAEFISSHLSDILTGVGVVGIISSVYIVMSLFYGLGKVHHDDNP